MRHFGAARSAPRRPEIYKNDLSLFIFKLKGRVVYFSDFRLRDGSGNRRIIAGFFSRFISFGSSIRFAYLRVLRVCRAAAAAGQTVKTKNKKTFFIIFKSF
jgi:hypothetical protein